MGYFSFDSDERECIEDQCVIRKRLNMVAVTGMHSLFHPIFDTPIVLSTCSRHFYALAAWYAAKTREHHLGMTFMPAKNNAGSPCGIFFEKGKRHGEFEHM